MTEKKINSHFHGNDKKGNGNDKKGSGNDKRRSGNDRGKDELIELF